MEGVFWVLLLVIVAVAFAAFFLIWSRLERLESALGQLPPRVDSAKELFTRALDDLRQRTIEAEEKVDRAVRTLERLSEVNRSIQESTQKFAEIFLSSERRGQFGELVLEEILRQHLPSYMYQTQFEVGGGERVDAVIRLKNVQVPIDAKFPSQLYRAFLTAQDPEEKKRAWKKFLQAMKSKIKTIAGKYIKPDRRTANFAVMFIPSEPVLSLLTNPVDPFGEQNPLWDYAVAHRVILAGPYTLMGILSSLLAVSQTEQLAERVFRMQADLKAAENSLKRAADTLSKIRSASDALSRHVLNLERQLEEALLVLSRLFEKEVEDEETD